MMSVSGREDDRKQKLLYKTAKLALNPPIICIFDSFPFAQKTGD